MVVISAQSRSKGSKPLFVVAARAVLPVVVIFGTLITVKMSVNDIMGVDLAKATTLSRPRDLSLAETSTFVAAPDNLEDVQPLVYVPGESNDPVEDENDSDNQDDELENQDDDADADTDYEEDADVAESTEQDESPKDEADETNEDEHGKNEEPLTTSSQSNEMNATESKEIEVAFTPKEGTRFEPGTLPLSRAEVISQCYLEPDIKYFLAKSCAYSPDYGVMLTMSGKTGSSTQRHVMGQLWNGTYGNCKTLEKGGLTPGTKKVVATREPLDHFLSGFKEMILRAQLWEQPMDTVYEHIPTEYNSFLDVVKDMGAKERAALKKSGEPNDLKLKAQMLDAFVAAFDGRVFDEHLSLQAIKLRDTNKKMSSFDYTLESENLSEELADLAKIVGAPIPPPIQKRSHGGEPLGEEMANDETIQKICRLRASDYCCMNYELPEICKKAGVSKKVECEWVQNPHNKDQLAIKAINMEEQSSAPEKEKRT